MLVKDSSSRSFVLSMLIGLVYEYFLKYKNLSGYLLDVGYERVNFIDGNKEGIFSCVGYLAISLATDSVCYKIKAILNKG